MKYVKKLTALFIAVVMVLGAVAVGGMSASATSQSFDQEFEHAQPEAAVYYFKVDAVRGSDSSVETVYLKAVKNEDNRLSVHESSDYESLKTVSVSSVNFGGSWTFDSSSDVETWTIKLSSEHYSEISSLSLVSALSDGSRLTVGDDAAIIGRDIIKSSGTGWSVSENENSITLNLDNYVLTSSKICIYAKNLDLTITGNAELTVTDSASEAILINTGNLTLNGNFILRTQCNTDGALRVAGGLTVSGGSLNAVNTGKEKAIWVDTMTVSGGSVYAECSSDIAIWVVKTMAVSGGSVYAKTESTDENYCAVYADDGITLSNGEAFVKGNEDAKEVLISVLRGEGTTESPYQISTYAGLKEFASKVNNGEPGACAVLTADIDASASDPDHPDYDVGTTAWTPIGNDFVRYTGVFDGDGHIITGLTFNNPDQNYAGLFGFVGEGGKIRNVGLEDGKIKGAYSVGGVAGVNFGTVTNCYNTGDVSGSDDAGGVVGDNYGTVTDCYNTGDVSGTGNNVGGVTGFISNNAEVKDCYNTGDVSGTGNNVGGVAGINSNEGKASNCYNTGDVSGTGNNVGGVIGINYGTVTDCYNTGDVSGSRNVGGVAGFIGINAEVKNCYNTGDVSGSSYVGCVVGYNNGKVTNCYYDSSVCNVSQAIGYGSGTNVTGLTKKAMTAGTYTDGAVSNMPGFKAWSAGSADEDAIWLVRESDDFYSYYPHLAGFDTDAQGSQLPAENIRKTEWPARAAKDGVTEISDYNELKAFASAVNSGRTILKAILIKNIDASASDPDADGYVAADAWDPIGNNSNRYAGTFDGDGHRITGLIFNNSNQYYVGLFGYVVGGFVKNVGLEGGKITAYDYVGGVVGYNSFGTITNCYNTGDVTGKNYVGGVAGWNSYTITNCYNTGNIMSIDEDAYVGGVAGINLGTITNCYNTGDVTGKDYGGGVVGYNVTQGKVTNCYNTGSAMATDEDAYAGGVVGRNDAAITNCYNTGNVKATNRYANAGGVAGENFNAITNCYNTGSVTADKFNGHAGGVVGRNYDGTIANCYYNESVCGKIGAVDGEDTATVTGLTKKAMTAGTYTDGAVSNMPGFKAWSAGSADEDAVWLVRESDDFYSYYPHLKGFAYDAEPTAENWPPKIVNVIEYPLWVGGNQVTSGNMDSLDALDGISVSDGGSVKFEPKADGKGGTLYLNNATITGTQSYKSGGTHDSNILVENKEFNITINLEDENTLGPAERGIWMANSSASSGLALTGDGKLSITAEKNGIAINCDLLIDGADINVTATGGDSGGTGIIADDIDIRNSSVYAEGTGDQYGIFCASALTISDSSVESGCTGTYGRGLYFSDEENFTVSGDSFVTLEGGTRYGALWIKGSLITKNGNEIVEPANYIIDPLETGSDVYLVYDVTADEKIPAVNVIITNPLTITVTSNPAGGGTITGGGKTYKGADVTLTAAPETGYDFVSWTEGTSVVSTNAKYLFTVEQSRNLVANFKLQVKSVSVSANPTEGGTVTGGGTYDYGSSATVTATPKDHYHFVNWTENGEEVSTNANYSFPVTGDRNLVANFAKDKHTVEFVNDDGAGLQSVQVPYGETPAYTGETPTKEPTAQYTYSFAGWSPEITSVSGDVTYTATYTKTAIEYTAKFVNENGETVAEIPYTVETVSIKDKEPAVPVKEGYNGEWEKYELTPGGITVKPIYTPADICPLDDEYHGTSFWGRLVKFFHTVIFRAFALAGLNIFFKIS